MRLLILYVDTMLATSQPCDVQLPLCQDDQDYESRKLSLLLAKSTMQTSAIYS